MELLLRHLPGGTEENYENLIQDSRCPGRYSNRVPPELERILYTNLFSNKMYWFVELGKLFLFKFSSFIFSVDAEMCSSFSTRHKDPKLI
jgi:hypothetical protein